MAWGAVQVEIWVGEIFEHGWPRINDSWTWRELEQSGKYVSRIWCYH
jgi:hypothetical protein